MSFVVAPDTRSRYQMLLMSAGRTLPDSLSEFHDAETPLDEGAAGIEGFQAPPAASLVRTRCSSSPSKDNVSIARSD